MDYNNDLILTELVMLAFTGSIGMTFVILACALPAYKVWWPMIVVIFYLLSPIPTYLFHDRAINVGGNSRMDFAIFITMGLVVSSFALPIMLARTPVNEPTIAPGACYFTLIGNLIVYLTYIGYFLTLYQDDDYSIW